MITTQAIRPSEPVAGKTFEELLVHGGQDELEQLKAWLFAENIRIETAAAELHRIEQKFIAERKQFQDEMKDLNQKIVREKKRLKEDSAFFDKKMEILKSGFAQLDLDKRKLEKERLHFQSQKEAALREAGHGRHDTIEYLFRGASNPLALKKRYKELMKMFHPDNVAGDHEIVLGINRYYEKMCGHYDFVAKKQA